jgi:hypothetical protein
MAIYRFWQAVIRFQISVRALINKAGTGIIFSGTTAAVLPLKELRADVKNLDTESGYEEMLLSDEAFAGSLSHQNKQGVFAINLLRKKSLFKPFCYTTRWRISSSTEKQKQQLTHFSKQAKQILSKRCSNWFLQSMVSCFIRITMVLIGECM